MLTIYIPTYNRVKPLQLLLSSLFVELDENPFIAINVVIKIFNNGSSDDTENYLKTIKRSNVYICNRESNIGATANIAAAVDNCDSEYLWILGDDDIPYSGLTTQIVHSLTNQKPDLLYLPAVWCKDVFEKSIPSVSFNLDVQKKDPEQFLKIVGAKLTFISSFVFSFDNYSSLKNNNDVDLAGKTDFPHFAFYSPAILAGKSLFVMNKIVIRATGNSSFQYSLLQSFGVELPIIAQKIFVNKKKYCDLVINNLLVAFFPTFLYSIRFGFSKSLDDQIPWKKLEAVLGEYKAFWFFVYPLKFLPKLFVLPLIMISRLFR
jgi:glycosyltransferase involved in cell wall biosynthesis